MNRAEYRAWLATLSKETRALCRRSRRAEVEAVLSIHRKVRAENPSLTRVEQNALIRKRIRELADLIDEKENTAA